MPEIDIRIIKGTRSHDFNQLDILKVFKEKAGSHFKIIEKNEVEVFNGYRILYLPEEYPTDYDDIRAFIYDRCVEYHKVMSPKNKNTNILVDINSGMWTEYDIERYLYDNFRNASLFVVDYVYGFDIDLPDYDDRWREIRYSFMEVEDSE